MPLMSVIPDQPMVTLSELAWWSLLQEYTLGDDATINT